jgi:hypothetical protein
MSEKSNFVSGIKADSGVQSLCEKYFASVFQKVMIISMPSRLDKEGRIAIVTNARRDAMDVVVLSDVQCGADGQVVWSWRPWAGAKRAGDPAGDGD